jgi:hypothetical protein
VGRRDDEFLTGAHESRGPAFDQYLPHRVAREVQIDCATRGSDGRRGVGYKGPTESRKLDTSSGRFRNATWPVRARDCERLAAATHLIGRAVPPWAAARGDRPDPPAIGPVFIPQAIGSVFTFSQSDSRTDSRSGTRPGRPA